MTLRTRMICYRINLLLGPFPSKIPFFKQGFSFKDTLLQAGTNNEEKPVEKEEDDIVVQEGDVIMELSDGIPSLKFLERVHSLIQNSDYKVFRSED
ncbi:hypothetical protein Godav_028151 [Gossypium davidsonii]|nr:hypothetical protein [Gossypium davidsonii]